MKVSLCILSGVGICWAAFIWVAAGQIVRPPRGDVSAYSRQWLLNPSRHGLKFIRETAQEGRIPYLIAEPDAEAGPGERGLLVREQLATSGAPLRPFGDKIGTIVLLHGRTGRKDAMLPIAERFCAAGFRCVIPDLPAQGESPLDSQTFGATRSEGDLPSAIVKDAAAKYRFDQQPTGVFGMSMGSAYAVSAASRHPEQWRAVVLLSTFDSLPTVIRSETRRLLGPISSICVVPIEAVARLRGGVRVDQIAPAEWAKGIVAPTMVIHGANDRLFAAERGKRLYEAVGSREKEWIDVEGGSHDRVLTTAMPLYAKMSLWFLLHMAVEMEP